MKSKILGCITAMTLFAALTISIRLSAQEQEQQASSTQQPTITEFNAPHAGSGSGQGTVPQGNNPAGAITGYYITGNNVFHGFLRTPDGTITSFDPPGSGTLKGSSQGTVPLSINSQGEIMGQYQDENYLYHGFLRAPDGTFTTIDSPGAGTEAGQGTIAENIGPEGLIAGYYLDANNVCHGFVRARDGAITTFDAPGAGTGTYQGTLVTSTEQGINREGAIIGWYIDSDYVYHGYLRSPDGSTFTTIDGPGAAYTILSGLTPAGAVAGYFGDASNVGHGLLFADGTLTTFDDRRRAQATIRVPSSLTSTPKGQSQDSTLTLVTPITGLCAHLTENSPPSMLRTRPEVVLPRAPVLRPSTQRAPSRDTTLTRGA